MAEASQIAPAEGSVRHLAFRIADAAFAVPLRRVKEVLPFAGEVRVEPNPETVRGVIDAAGLFVPLLDLGLKFRRAEVVPASETCVVVVEARGAAGPLRFGLVADRVDSIVDLTVEDVDPPPLLPGGNRAEWLEGLGHLGDEDLLLLDLDQLLTELEQWRIARLAASPSPA